MMVSPMTTPTSRVGMLIRELGDRGKQFNLDALSSQMVYQTPVFLHHHQRLWLEKTVTVIQPLDGIDRPHNLKKLRGRITTFRSQPISE